MDSSGMQRLSWKINESFVVIYAFNYLESISQMPALSPRPDLSGSGSIPGGKADAEIPPLGIPLVCGILESGTSSA